MNECPKCQSEEIIKSGNHHGRQWYRCKNCGFQFTGATPRGRPAKDKAMAVTLYMLGLLLNSIAKLFQVSTPAVLRWVKFFAEKTYEKPEPREAVVVELDEMWHYLHQKKTNYGYGKLIVVLPVSSLIGNVAVVIKKTFKRLYDRLKRWNIWFYFADNRSVYSEEIPENVLFQGKSGTVAIEKNNGRQRHRLARFRRKSIVVSKSLHMVELTMALFAGFHVNGNIDDIATFFC